ncbi:MAG: Gfo/Idh/MocA family oxidoreductase [Phycisphaerae bacterium]|nr:Gfo/Idh/MocA family oxidoreductase [Phycisphaerae bacterium]
MYTTGKSGGMDRRVFLQTAGVAAAAFTFGTTRRVRAASANDKLGIGVIGCGGRGNNHLDGWNWLKSQGDNLEIVAVCDVYRPRMQKTAEKFSAKGYMDHRELLADPRVDIVSIATPDHLHAPQTIDAVRAGKGVYCEKPITHWRQFELLKKMRDEVKKSKCAFLLGTQGMSDGAWHEMKKLVKEGLIGQPIHAECGYFRVGDWGERGMPIDDPNAKPGTDLNWEAFLGDSPQRAFDVSRFFRWRMYEDYAGGPVTDLFPHSFTPVADILGVGTPSMVVATGGKFRYEEREIPDTFNMLIDYPEKCTAAVLGTQGNDFVAEGQRGAPGRIPVIRGWDGSLMIDRKTNKIAFVPTEGSGKKTQFFDIEYGEDFGAHLRNLVQCHRQGRQDSFSPIDLAFSVQTALIMGMLALREQTAAKYDAVKQQIVL